MHRCGELIGWMAKNQKTQQDLADLLGIPLYAANLKLNGKRDFRLTECERICKAWGLSMDIFLS